MHESFRLICVYLDNYEKVRDATSLSGIYLYLAPLLVALVSVNSNTGVVSSYRTRDACADAIFSLIPPQSDKPQPELIYVPSLGTYCIPPHIPTWRDLHLVPLVPYHWRGLPSQPGRVFPLPTEVLCVETLLLGNLGMKGD